MYDVAIIGAGISGLYCGLHIPNHIIFESERVGGRIHTHYDPYYEISAGRFNHSHKILWSLIKKYNLKTHKIPRGLIYKEITNNKIKDIPAERFISNCIDYILHHKHSNLSNTQLHLHLHLRNITFYKHCINLIGKENTDLLVSTYGYYSEFKVMNAYDALRLFNTSHIYYVLDGGMSTLCKEMEKGLNIKMEKVTSVEITSIEKTSIEKYAQVFKVNNVYAKKVIFTIPTSQLHFPILKQFYSEINSVVPMKICRIYIGFEKPWLQRTTTNSFLRHMIPFGNIVMISYTDGQDVLPFLSNGKIKPKKEIKKMVIDELHKLYTDVPKVNYFECYYWPAGTHTWPTHVNSDEISEKMIHPMPNLYICGDGLSHTQGWMEH